MAEKATTAIFLDKWHPQKNGKCAISIRVTHQRKKRYFPTIHSLTEDDFDAMFSAERPRDGVKKLKLELSSLENKAADIIKEMPFFTWHGFLKKFQVDRGKADTLSYAFDEYAKQLRSENRIGTAVTYECAKNSIVKFKPEAIFTDVTPAFLSKYERLMLDAGNSITTVGIYLRSLRTLFNIAITDGQLSQDHYPFGKRKYEIPASKNTKKALPLSDVSLIYHHKPEPGSITERARDYWLFTYFCNGINVKDLCLLKYKNLQGDILSFERAKTIRTKRVVEPVRVSLLDEAKAIIKKWGNDKKDGDTFIFPVLKKGLTADRERQLIQQITHSINDHMKEIARALKIDKSVTTYVARHTFSTVLKRSGASTEAISEALGHSNIKTTQNYLASFEDDSKKEMAKALTAFKNETSSQNNK